MAKLTYKQREALPKSAFVIKDGEEKYPIHDAAHARNALARVMQHGTSQERRKVVNAVRRKYPDIEISGRLLRMARRGQ